MASAQDHSRFLNPCMLHLQKLALELKCPLCLEFLSRPLLLPCSHLICSSCLPKSAEFDSACLVCKSPFLSQDLRNAPVIENMVAIYKSLDTAFGAFLLQLKVAGSVLNGTNLGHAKPRTFSSDNSRLNDLASNVKEASKKPMIRSKLTGEREASEVLRLGRDVFFQDVKEVVVRGDASASNCTLSKNKERDSQKCNTNPPDQRSPGTPPPFGDTKDSDDDNNGRHSDLGVGGKEQECSMNLLQETVSPSLSVNGAMNKSVANVGKRSISSIESDTTGEAKRQKLECVLQNLSSKVDFTCVFCQTSKDTEVTGSMLHYINGTAIKADQANHCDVFHVHKSCTEWAPQAYFVGETAMNLEAEVARGAKLKCTGCGKKGAALGCYAKSCRRSYHLPCAAKVDGCRWDYDNFLMLCPAHVALKFPNERSKSRKKLRSNQSIQIACEQLSPNLSDQQSNEFWLASPDVTSRWVLCGSSLSAAEKDLLAKFSILSGATLIKAWDSSVTHVVASTDEMGACGRTLKVLMAILNGRWILNMDWIRACLEAKHPIAEEPFEISRDIYGCCDGAKNGRKRIIEKAPKLFSGINFYLSDQFDSSYRGYLEELIIVAGGTILSDKEEICPTDSDYAITIIIYSLETPETCQQEELNSVIEKRLAEAEALASETSARVAGHTWLLDSIAACKLLSLTS